MGIKVVSHPPNSPDLAPCDFWLFPQLRGCRYETIEEMKEAVTKVIDTLTQEDFYGPSRRCWNGITSALQPEEVTSKDTRVSCVYYKWKCPYEKSLETYRMHLVLFCSGCGRHILRSTDRDTKLQFISFNKSRADVFFAN